MSYTIERGINRTKTKLKVMAVGLVAATMPAAIAISSGAASAAAGYTLFGEASLVSPGNSSPKAVKMVSDSDPGFGGIDFSIPIGTTFADFTSLGTDYMFETDDSCAGGSPRFQINVDNGAGDTGNIFVYIGPAPSYTLCPPSVWTSSGDLLEGANPIDTSQLDAGTFYDPYATALVKYGGYMVTGVQLVTDGAFAFSDGEQTTFADNTNINGTVYTYDQPSSKDECKNGGWESLTDADGNPFKNQGQCVSYVNHHDGNGQDDNHAH